MKPITSDVRTQEKNLKKQKASRQASRQADQHEEDFFAGAPLSGLASHSTAPNNSRPMRFALGSFRFRSLSNAVFLKRPKRTRRDMEGDQPHLSLPQDPGMAPRHDLSLSKMDKLFRFDAIDWKTRGQKSECSVLMRGLARPHTRGGGQASPHVTHRNNDKTGMRNTNDSDNTNKPNLSAANQAKDLHLSPGVRCKRANHTAQEAHPFFAPARHHRPAAYCTRSSLGSGKPWMARGRVVMAGFTLWPSG